MSEGAAKVRAKRDAVKMPLNYCMWYSTAVIFHLSHHFCHFSRKSIFWPNSLNMASSEPSQEVLANYQKLTQECQLLQSKIAEFETELIEHK